MPHVVTVERPSQEQPVHELRRHSQLAVPHYVNLGIALDASAQDVRNAYRRRALETHPDKGGHEAEFNKVQEACGILGVTARHRCGQ